MNTSFAERVYRAAALIPRGSVSTYRELARAIGNPGAARAVGTALSRNRSPRIPCHRVVRSDGSVGGYAWGTAKKIARLRAEGVEVQQGKIDLTKFKVGLS